MAKEEKIKHKQRMTDTEHNRNEKITLIKHSLLSAIYQNRHEKVEIWQLLNRFLALIQDHVVIVVLSKQEEQNRYKIIYHTMFDPVWQNEFEKELQRKGEVEGDHIYWSNEYCESGNNSYILHETKRFAFFIANFSHNDRGSYDPPVFELCSEDKLEEYCIPDLLREFSSNDEHAPRKKQTLLNNLYLSEKLNDKFQYREQFWEKGNYNARKLYSDETRHVESLIEFDKFLPETLKAVKAVYPKWPQDYFKIQHSIISSIFEKTFNDIKDSPIFFTESTLHTGNLLIHDPPTNVIFSIRSFSTDRMRYRGKSDSPHYPYEVRTFLPDSQKKQLRNVLGSLKKENIPESRLFNGNDSFFWDHLEKGEIDEIFNIIESPEGETARALSDMVFTSGFVRVSDSPFRTKGINRLDKHVWEKAQEGIMTDDYKRLVCHHYLGYVMVPIAKQLSAFLVPVQVSGTPWGCLAFFYDSGNNDNTHKRWVQNYHYYFSLSDHVFSDIRSRLKMLFLASIEELYGLLVNYFFGTASEKKFPDDKSVFASTFNQCAKIVARMYPFDLVILGGISLKESSASYKVVNKAQLPIQLIENPYYTRRITKSFTSYKEIIHCFRQAEYTRAFRKKLDGNVVVARFRKKRQKKEEG